MKLSNGHEVIEYLMENGATHVEREDRVELSEAEWQEYCANVRALNLEQSRQREQLKQLCATWEALPAGSFKESGTEVNAALIVITA